MANSSVAATFAATKRRQSPRAQLVATLADAVKAAAEAGDLVAMRVASRALEELVGQPGDDGAIVVDMAQARKRGRS